MSKINRKHELYLCYGIISFCAIAIIGLTWLEPSVLGFYKVMSGMLLGLVVAGPLSYYMKRR